jgi:hypothetical protein
MNHSLFLYPFTSFFPSIPYLHHPLASLSPSIPYLHHPLASLSPSLVKPLTFNCV